MEWSKAINYLKEGKCKGLTRLDLPSQHYVTLFKYTITWYNWTHGLNKKMSEPKHSPDDIIMYCRDCLDSPGRWVNLGMWNDDGWLLYERVFDEGDL